MTDKPGPYGFARLLLVALALMASGRAQADGWRYYEPNKGMRFSTYEVDDRPGQLGPITISCENFILKLSVVVPKPRQNTQQGMIRIESLPRVAIQAGTLMQGADGYFLTNNLTFNDPIFSMIERGDFVIKGENGLVLGTVKHSNPYLTDLVYNCRKGG